ncbi:MAG: hypothetical protein ACFFDI_07210 [Promethearchaeota archaeon]
MSFNINEVLTPNLQKAKEQALLLVKAGQSIILRSKEGEFTALSQVLAKELDQSLILHSLALLSPDKKNFEDISSKKFIIFSSRDKLDVMESTRVNGSKLNLTDYQYPDEIIK